MIFAPFPRLVGPIPSQLPLAGEKVASMKNSRSSITPDSRSVFANWQSHHKVHLYGTAAESSDEPSYIVVAALEKHVSLGSRVQDPEHAPEELHVHEVALL
jgi:hypothetical protein